MPILRSLILTLIVLLTCYADANIGNLVIREFLTEKGAEALGIDLNELGEFKELQTKYIDGLEDITSRIHPATHHLYDTITLTHEKLGDVQLTIRYPTSQRPTEPKPVVFFVTGLFSGHRILEYMGDVGDNVLVAFSYPLDREASFRHPNQLLNSLRRIYEQISASLKWVSQQDWADSNRLHTVGVSLGTVVLPLGLRWAQANGVQVQSTVLAYGGANLGDVIARELTQRLGFRDPGRDRTVRDFLETIWTPLDPIHHLPHLQGDFLVIQGEGDDIVPEEATQALLNRLPNGRRTHKKFAGGHINLDKWDLIADVRDYIFAWMQDKGFINP